MGFPQHPAAQPGSREVLNQTSAAEGRDKINFGNKKLSLKQNPLGAVTNHSLRWANGAESPQSCPSITTMLLLSPSCQHWHVVGKLLTSFIWWHCLVRTPMLLAESRQDLGVTRYKIFVKQVLEGCCRNLV